MKFGNNIDLNKNELQNARIQNLASAPGSPVVGQIYHDTASGNSPHFYNGSWIRLSWGSTDPYARANHTGTQTASTISDLATVVKAYKVSEFAAAIANVAMGGFKITGLATPTVAGDAAEYSWVLSQCQTAAAGIDAKASVRAATVAAGTLASSFANGSVIDGVTLVTGDRILIKNQATATENGIYKVNVSGAPTRATDCDSATNYTSQAFTFVEEGTTLSGSQWKVSTTGVFVIGTTNITWAQFGAGSAYTNGNGLNLTSVTFSIKLPASSGLTVDASGLYLDTAIAVRKYATTIGDGTTTSIVVTHNLNTRDVNVSVIEAASSWNAIMVDWQATTVNTITVIFATAPTASQYRVLVTG